MTHDEVHHCDLHCGRPAPHTWICWDCHATLTEEDRELLLSWLYDTSFTDASIAEILTDEGHPAKDYHVTHWRDRNIEGAKK